MFAGCPTQAAFACVGLLSFSLVETNGQAAPFFCEGTRWAMQTGAIIDVTRLDSPQYRQAPSTRLRLVQDFGCWLSTPSNVKSAFAGNPGSRSAHASKWLNIDFARGRLCRCATRA